MKFIKIKVLGQVLKGFIFLIFLSASFLIIFDKYKEFNKPDKSLYKRSTKPNANDIFWANEILKGGYILHFRHAEREKWLDVKMYDALESDVHAENYDATGFGETRYYNKAVCLSERGLVQARAIGEVIEFANLPFSKVISSVSCRSRQTAKLAFGKIDQLSRLLVHTGPYNEDYADRVEKLRKFYLDLKPDNGKNIIVSAHNGVLLPEMFENQKADEMKLEEGGFYILSNSNGKLRVEHKFYKFRQFASVFFIR